jgi:hypothetical protein
MHRYQYLEAGGAFDMVDKQQFLIDTQLAQVILDYLAQRPYHEVYQLIAALQRLAPAPEREQSDEMLRGR